MKLILYISLIASICIGCASQKTKISQQSILTEKFLETDSLSIAIEYRDVLDCTSNEPLQRIAIIVYNDISKVFVYKSFEDKQSIGPIKGTVITEIHSFEKRAKEVTGCGGYDGKHGIRLRLIINGEEDNFGFCKDDWDGINELLSDLMERETK